MSLKGIHEFEYFRDSIIYQPLTNQQRMNKHVGTHNAQTWILIAMEFRRILSVIGFIPPFWLILGWLMVHREYLPEINLLTYTSLIEYIIYAYGVKTGTLLLVKICWIFIRWRTKDALKSFIRTTIEETAAILLLFVKINEFDFEIRKVYCKYEFCWFMSI